MCLVKFTVPGVHSLLLCRPYVDLDSHLLLQDKMASTEPREYLAGLIFIVVHIGLEVELDYQFLGFPFTGFILLYRSILEIILLVEFWYLNPLEETRDSTQI